MAVTHNSAGFTGTVDQVAEARRFAVSGGGRFRVASSTDWTPTASGSVNRTINISAGAGSACGVYDATTSTDALTLATNTGSVDRFDAIVAKFDWSTLAVTFAVIQGSSTGPPTVNPSTTTVNNAQLNRIPGLRYDALLAVVRVRPSVTLIAPADVIDSRLFGSWSVLQTPNATYRSSMDVEIGQVVLETFIGGSSYQYSGPVLGWLPGPAPMSCYGKMWRTSGFTYATAANTTIPIAMDQARLTGGMVFENANDCLTVPFDGIYQITMTGYVSGGTSTGSGAQQVDRVRSGVSDLTVVRWSFNKTGGGDEYNAVTGEVPLKAGDRLQMRLNYSNTALNVFGTLENYGVSVAVRWQSPLFGNGLPGATP